MMGCSNQRYENFDFICQCLCTIIITYWFQTWVTVQQFHAKTQDCADQPIPRTHVNVNLHIMVAIVNILSVSITALRKINCTEMVPLGHRLMVGNTFPFGALFCCPFAK